MFFTNWNWQLEWNEEMVFSHVPVESISSSIWCQDLGGKGDFFAIPDFSCHQGVWQTDESAHLPNMWNYSGFVDLIAFCEIKALKLSLWDGKANEAIDWTVLSQARLFNYLFYVLSICAFSLSRNEFRAVKRVLKSLFWAESVEQILWRWFEISTRTVS